MPIIFKGSGNKKPKLYEGDFFSSTSSETYTPKAGYDGWSSVYVFGYSPYYTDGNASSSDVRSGKTFYSGGSSRTGNMSDVTMPFPDVEHSFSSDKTQITFTVSYTPKSTGYNGYATARTKTAYIDMPETTIQGAVYQSGILSRNAVKIDNIMHMTLTIPDVSGKTLKRVVVVHSGTSYIDGGNALVQIININYADDKLDLVYIRRDLTGSHDDKWEHSDGITGGAFIFNKESTGYVIKMSVENYSVYDKYRYIAVYE